MGAIELLPAAIEEIETAPKRSFTTCLVRKVADKLGNTVAVCRSSYIHPVILASAEEHRNDFDSLMQTAETKDPDLQEYLSPAERAALYLLERESG